MAAINWSDLVKNTTPGVAGAVPPGRYSAVVSKAEYKPTNDHPMWKVELTIEEGEQKNRKAFLNISITEKSAAFALANLIALGTTHENVTAALRPGNEEGIARVCADLIDTPVVITIEDKGRTWNGRAQTDITSIEPVVYEDDEDDDDDEATAVAPAPAPAPAPKAAKKTSTRKPVTPF